MNMRYFLIYSPIADFTGKVGPMAFADGVARVSFDDTRSADGVAVGEELRVSVGRSAVLFAKRHTAQGYRVVETDDTFKPLPTPEEAEAAKKESAAAARKAAAEKKAADEAARKAAENGGAK